MQRDSASDAYLLLFLSPQAHLAEKLKEARDGHPYMLWTSHAHHGEHELCGSWQSILRFFVGCDPMVLLQRFGLTHRPVFHLRVGRRLRDDELQSQ